LGQLVKFTTLDLTRIEPANGGATRAGATGTAHTVDNNELTAVPPALGNLPLLDTLKLELNQLTAVPPELGKTWHGSQR
jgi:hypothetical protein